jgi:hydroxypyruvate isomerase
MAQKGPAVYRIPLMAVMCGLPPRRGGGYARAMLRFAANLWFLFPEVPFLERFAAAAANGFRGVEYHFPYAHPPEVVAEVLRAAGLEQVLFNMPAGDWDAGEVGIAALPGREGEFRDGVGRAIEYAKALGCTRLNALAGRPADGEATAAHWDTYKDNLAFAADACRAEGIDTFIEPINSHTVPGYLLNFTGQAVDVITELARPNLFVEYDVFHAQIMEGDLTETLKAHLDVIRHIQIAGVPDRHEPDIGEVSFPHLFGVLEGLDYDGWIGCEYHPTGDTAAGLGWGRAYGLGASE